MIRPLIVAGLVLAAPSFASSQAIQGSLAGFFESSLDGGVYEIRPRGDVGLDIYDANGRLLAAMDRRNVKDDFKGRTDVLATACPNNSGKIETLDVSPGHIRMRIERSQRNPRGEVRCHMFGLVQWQSFSLTRTSGAGAARGPVDRPVPPGGGPTSRFADVHAQVTEAVAEADTVIVRFVLTNTGTDREFRASFYVACDGAGTLIDDGGETHKTNLAVIGNQDCNSTLVNGIRTNMTLRFTNMPVVAGVLKANQITNLTLANIRVGGVSGNMEFRNIPIRKSRPSDPSPIPPPPPSHPSHADVHFELRDAVARADVLTLSFTVTNRGGDRLLRVSESAPCANAAQIIDNEGNTFTNSTVTVGNLACQSELLNGVPTRMTITFTGLPTNGGVVEATEIIRLRLPSITVAGQPGPLEFRNIPIDKTK